MTDNIKLPPLPKASKMYDIPGYDEEDLKDYARAAVLADRASRDPSPPVEIEEIMVNTPYNVFILPLWSSGLSSGPRFVVHVPGPAGDGSHCATCTCNPNMTPAVRFDLSPAQQEGAIREHLIRLGWTPPDKHALAQPAAARVDVTWPLSILEAGYWREVYMGTKHMRLEVSYPYETWERLMAALAAAQQQLAEIEALWTEVVQLRRERAMLLDKLNGTPCAEVRWQQELDAAEARAGRLRKALEEIRKRSARRFTRLDDPFIRLEELGNIHQIADEALRKGNFERGL